MNGKQQQTAAPSRPPNPSLPHREDCWSEGESSVLIDAWGDRYLELNRGNLRQKQWQEVADAVNSRPCDARRPPRTDVQCKNRIDTLKKKYKSERSKIDDGSAPSSQWIFFNRLDYLIKKPIHATPPPPPPPPSSSSPPLALPLPSHYRNLPLPTATLVHPINPIPIQTDDSLYRKRSRSDSPPIGKGLLKRKRIEEEPEAEEETGLRELAKMVVRIGEIFEKVETEKQRQMVEMERERVEFVKSMELKRMQMFADLQVRLAKMVAVRGRGGGEGGRRRHRPVSKGGRASGSNSSASAAAAAALSFLAQPVLF